ncbi:MAG TPA: PD40 domain-containing protein [Oscillatoriales cyanobacterium M59_W2019_021]|nr:PD40 domain-containing protein [Oscillatoriales cyanobacterium M4454_W2019_049]HIK53529.1 PD40 domain-containing protein [Oscillatoriales cyanobacterium M59_W2019_021]
MRWSAADRFGVALNLVSQKACQRLYLYPKTMPLNAPHQLEFLEYLCWVVAAVGTLWGALSGQMLYAAVPLLFAFFLNWLGRRRQALWLRRQTLGAIARVHEQLSQDIQILNQQIQGLPVQVTAKTHNRLTLATPPLPTPSQERLSQLEDLQLIYQEIVQLQEQYASLRDSLVSVIDYLNQSPLPDRVNSLEQAIAHLNNRISGLQHQVEATVEIPASDSSTLPSGEEEKDATATTTPSSLPVPDRLSVLMTPTLPPLQETPADSSAVSPSVSFTVSSKEERAAEGETPTAEPAPPKLDLKSKPKSVSPVAPSPQLPMLVVPPPPQNWQRVATLTGHSDWVSDLAVAPDGQTLMSASFDKTLQLWNLVDRQSVAVLAEHTSPVCAIAVSPKGDFFASGSWDKTIKIWDATKRESLATLSEETTPSEGSVRSLAISPDGQILASGWFDRKVKLWKLKTNKRKTLTPTFLGSYGGHLGRVDAIAFSPDSHTLASGSADGSIKLWQLNTTGKPLQDLTHTLTEGADPITALAFSPDGKWLASGSRDRALQIWHLNNGKRSRQLDGHLGVISAVVFHPEGQLLASASADGTVRLWHVESGECIATLTGETGALLSLAMSPDGRALVCGRSDGAIELWQLASVIDGQDN